MWYFQTEFSDYKSGNPQRREASILNNLRSIHAWRGALVDHIISRYLVPSINRGEAIEPERLLEMTENLASRQISFAKKGEYRRILAPKDINDREDYCALYELEYGLDINNGPLQTAIEEATTSMKNLLNSDVLTTMTEDSKYLIAQRTLQFHLADVVVTCRPDLLVFFEGKPPLIIDWKVQSPQYRENWLQLGIYALALSRAKPHKDFPSDCLKYLNSPINCRLVECQLLRNQSLDYRVFHDDVVDIEDLISSSASDILRVLESCEGDPDTDILRIPSARSPSSCNRCNFRKICWTMEAQ